MICYIKFGAIDAVYEYSICRRFVKAQRTGGFYA